MGVFLVVHSNKNRVNECLVPEKLTAYDDALHVEYESRQIVRSNNGLFAFIHYERSDALYSAESQTYIHKENQKLSITLLQGYLWEKAGADGVIEAHKLDTMINADGCEKVRDHCNGEYSTIHYNESNNSLYVFNDRMGMESLYYYKDNTQLIVSNRVRLIREVLQKSSPDIETLNWIIAVGIIVGEGTSEKEVTRLPQAAYLSVSNNRIEIHENNVFMIDDEFNKTLHERSKTRSFPFSLFGKKKNSIDSIIDGAIEECAINIETCLKQAPKTLIPLSGGKDSRAVLALSNYGGKKEDINVFTNGFSEHADVVVAKKISDHMNLDLQVNTPKAPIEVSDDWVFDKMMGHSFQTDGLHSSWDAKGYTATSGGLSLTGHIGEVYRSNYNKSGSIDLSSVRTASQMFKSANIFDKAGFLNLSAKKHYENKLQERMSFYLDNGSELSDLPDIIYSMERVPTGLPP